MYVPSAILSTSNLLHNLKEIKNIAKKGKNLEIKNNGNKAKPDKKAPIRPIPEAYP
jgi:hypothetical protein